MSKIKIGYFADGPWAHEALKLLISDQEFEIVFICVRYDTRDPALIDMGGKLGIQCLWHKNINSDEFHMIMKKFEFDIFVSMSFNQIFRPRTYELPKLKTINCHAGALPYYRGRNILNWALINDEKEFGITVHYIDEGIDTGDIIIQNTYPIKDDDSYRTLLETSHKECAILLHQALRLIHTKSVNPTPQSSIHPVGFYCSARKEGDEVLNWNQSSREIFNFVRAICDPGPRARSYVGDVEIYINRVELIDGATNYIGIPGVILNKDENGYFWIKTADSFVRLTEYRSDRKLRVGDRLCSGIGKI